QYQMTLPTGDVDREHWFRSLDRMLKQGARLLRLQDDSLSDRAYADLASAVIDRARRQSAAVMLDRSADMVVDLGAGGWHCSGAQIRHFDHRPIGREYWLAVACQTERDLVLALATEADFAVVSPVVTAGSNPDSCLGWPGFERLRGDYALPVYAGGDMVPADEKDAIMHNAQGIERR